MKLAITADKIRQTFIGPFVKNVEKPFVALAAYRGPKTISAMLRVKNEEEFLREAILSIIPHVEEVVIIDNNSTDTTPQIIADLAAEFPQKIRCFNYPYQVARYGEENQRLASTREGRNSPALLKNFYNWCVNRCRHPFILKWDGDTIATKAFAEALRTFKNSPKQALWITGANLHPNRTHLIEGKPYEEIEPRLFFRRLAFYDNSLGYCETLRSPYIGKFIEYSEFVNEPAYIHMKFCKRDRYLHMSRNLQDKMRQIDNEGDPVDAALMNDLQNWCLSV